MLSCNSSNQNEIHDDNTIPLNLSSIKNNIDYIFASDLISDIEYIPLETTSECLIDGQYGVHISENYILVSSGGTQCIQFSAEGKYIRNIGKRGRGPGEYTDFISNVVIDENSDLIFIISSIEIIAYRISGEYVKKLDLLKFKQIAGLSSSSFLTIKHWKDDLFGASFNLDSGKDPYSFILFSLDGEVIKIFPNNITFEADPGFMAFEIMIPSPHEIYNFKEQLYYKEMYSDTIFRINDQLEFVPEIIFDMAGYRLPMDKRGKSETDLSDYM